MAQVGILYKIHRQFYEHTREARTVSSAELILLPGVIRDNLPLMNQRRLLAKTRLPSMCGYYTELISDFACRDLA